MGAAPRAWGKRGLSPLLCRDRAQRRQPCSVKLPRSDLAAHPMTVWGDRSICGVHACPRRTPEEAAQGRYVVVNEVYLPRALRMRVVVCRAAEEPPQVSSSFAVGVDRAPAETVLGSVRN